MKLGISLITLDQAIAIIHATVLTRRDTLILLLGINVNTPQQPASLKELGRQAGVKGIGGWNPSAILADSKGLAVSNGNGWSLSGLGRNRVVELAQSAGVFGATKPANGATSIADSGASCCPQGRVFLGHGRSPAWKDLRQFLEAKLHLCHDEFNRVSTAGLTNVERLEQMLRESAFAFIVLTGEDEQKDGKVRARQNVVHEAGLFQGRHGFKRAIILLEEGCEDFSNVEGLTHISFPKGKILAAAEDIRDVLVREGVLVGSAPTK